MNQLKTSLIEVRKAYRLLFDFQNKVLKLIEFIGNEYGRAYSGGNAKFSANPPKNGKGSLSNWAWDWLNLYYYEFCFHQNKEEKIIHDYFSIVLLSDSGFYEAQQNNPDLKKLEVNKFTPTDLSSTKLLFVFGKNLWECDGFFKNNCWEDPNFLLKNEGVHINEEQNGIMVFKSYPLERFENNSSTIEVLSDFSNFCSTNNIDFKLNRDKEK